MESSKKKSSSSSLNTFSFHFTYRLHFSFIIHFDYVSTHNKKVFFESKTKFHSIKLFTFFIFTRKFFLSLLLLLFLFFFYLFFIRDKFFSFHFYFPLKNYFFVLFFSYFNCLLFNVHSANEGNLFLNLKRVFFSLE